MMLRSRCVVTPFSPPSDADRYFSCADTCSAPSSHTLYCTVVLGAPGKDCTGHGICMVLPNRMRSDFTCAAIPASMAFVHGMVRLSIDKKGLSDSITNKYFKENIFVMEEGFCLPKWILKKIQHPYPLYIPDNHYPIIDTDEHLHIHFPLLNREPD